MATIKELDTSALSASPRSLTEGVLEVEGPISADAGVASCLLFDTEPVFRRLPDDLLEGKIFVVGMTQVGGFKVQKQSVKSASRSRRETSRRNNDTGETSRTAGKMTMGKRQKVWELGAGNSGTKDGCGARH